MRQIERDWRPLVALSAVAPILFATLVLLASMSYPFLVVAQAYKAAIGSAVGVGWTLYFMQFVQQPHWALVRDEWMWLKEGSEKRRFTPIQGTDWANPSDRVSLLYVTADQTHARRVGGSALAGDFQAEPFGFLHRANVATHDGPMSGLRTLPRAHLSARFRTSDES